jgi:SAM-dependent methyltransferase
MAAHTQAIPEFKMLSRAFRALRGILRMPAAQQAHLEKLQADIERSQQVLRERVEESDALLRAEATRLSDQLNLALGDLTLLTRRQIEYQREVRLLLGQVSLPPDQVWVGRLESGGGAPGAMIFPHSTVCRQESFETPYFAYWTAQIGHELRYHRKLWEFVFICQALFERDLIKPGMRGLGFGVGEEPLTAYFASRGCKITGTDLAPEAAAGTGWVETAQHASGKEALRRSDLCPDAVFDANVEFRFCDMNRVPDDLTGYDFCWSACALEHLGSIEQGLAFIERSLDCLKPGGVAVHTTEYNVSSNDETVDNASTVLFRQRDIRDLESRVNAAGHAFAPLNFDPGREPLDRYIDVAPYRDEPHLKLALQGYATTSIGVIIQKREIGV